MKAVLSNRIFIESNSVDLHERLSTELTYRIPSKLKGRFPETIRNYSKIRPNLCTIPGGRIDLIPREFEIIDKRLTAPVEFPIFRGTLRDSQVAIYDAVDSSCIINAAPSWGKTFAGIAIAAKLSNKTLVVTHTTMLRDQWVEEVRKTLGIEPGIIGAGRVDTNSVIVIANIQTLIKRLEVLDEFGTLIIDECHHTPASTFTTIVDKSKAKYKIGLSGTLERKDGKHVIFTDYFGNVVFKPEAENSMVPQVLLVDSGITFPGGKFWANRVTELEVHRPEYKNLIVDLADAAANKGHKVLVVASRTEFLHTCAEMTKNPSICITGLVRDMKERNRLLDTIGTGESSICWGTLSIFSEGISQSALSCIILATPINNKPMLTQLIGRIIRLREGKRTPLIIDIELKGAASVKTQLAFRKSHYLQNGYVIKSLKK
jgi:superfamily II DNA or RNA helicase